MYVPQASSDPQIIQPPKAQRNRRRHSDFSTIRRRSSGFSGGGAGSVICHRVEVSRVRSSSPLAVSDYKDAGYWQTVVSFTSSAMCILQGGYKSATTLTSGLSGTIGIAGSVIVYFLFTLGCFLMPPVMRFFELNTQLKFLAAIGSLGYTFFLYVNILGVDSDSETALYTSSVTLFIIASVLVGLGAPLVFVTSQEIVGRCAYFHSRDLTSFGGAGVVPRDCIAVKDFQSRLKMTNTKYSCIFFTFLQLQGVLLIPMAIIALKTSADAEWRVPLFWAMAMLPLASGFVFLMIPPVPKSDIIPGAPEPVTSPTDTLLFGLREKDMLRLIPACVTNGMVVGYVFGGFSRYLVAPILGVRTAVAAQSIFFIFNAFFTYFWGRLITTGRLSRGLAYFFATVAQLTFFITVISLHLLQTWLSSNFTPNPSGDGMLQWVQIDTPTSAEYWTIVGLILLLAFGDSLYEFELPANIQARFAPTRYHLVAISNYKAYQSLGYFIQFTVDLILGDDQLNSFYRGGMVHPSLILISILLAVSYLCLVLGRTRLTAVAT